MNRESCSVLAVAALLAAMTVALYSQNKNSSPPASPAPPARPAPQRSNSRVTTPQQSTAQGRSPVQRQIQPAKSTGGPLEPALAASTLHDLNVQRTRMQGINRGPLPVGTVTAGEDGMHTIATPDGRRYDVRSNGSIAYFSRGATVARYRTDGTPRLIKSQGILISHGDHGEQHFEAVLPGGERVVGWGSHEGYVEHPLRDRHGQYVQRTYVFGGRELTGVFRTFVYQGMTLANYVPARRYLPAFRTWLGRPWPKGMRYAWPWRNEMWAAPYRRHFDRAYSNFADWLADYVLAAALMQGELGQPTGPYDGLSGTFYTEGDQTEYTGRDNTRNGSEATLPADRNDPIKMPGIEDQVQSDVNSAAQDATTPDNAQAVPMSAALDAKVKLYLVASPIFTHNEHGDCTLTHGTNLTPALPPQPGAATVEMIVTASNKGDCAEWSKVPIGILALQEMRNLFTLNEEAGQQTAEMSKGENKLPLEPTDGVQIVQEGQPDPALTAGAAGEIRNQEERTGAVERAVANDAASGNYHPN